MNKIAEDVRRYFNEERFFSIDPRKLDRVLIERVGREIIEENDRYFLGSPAHDLNSIIEHYDRIGKASDIVSATHRYDRESFLQMMHSVIEEEKCGRVIDGGCGTGLDICFLALKFPDVDFVGYDVSGKHCSMTMERSEKRKLKNVNILRCATESMPLISSGADVIYFHDSFLEGGELGVSIEQSFSIYPETEKRLIKSVLGSKNVLKNRGALIFSMFPKFQISEDMVLCYFEANDFNVEGKTPFDELGGRSYILRKK